MRHAANLTTSRHGIILFRWPFPTQLHPTLERVGLDQIRKRHGEAQARTRLALEPKPQGNPGYGKLSEVIDWVHGRISAQPDLTVTN